jgi:molybdate transport repressor ModE-like protein
MPHKLALSPAVLDVRRLRVLVEIDRCGSFSAAAAALGMSQPAASQHVAALEHAVGLALVERGSRPVALTEAGHALVRHARGVLGRIDAAEQELAELAGRRSARLRLGGFPTALSALVPGVLAEYGRLRPDVVLSVVGDHMQRLLPRLHAGELDLALVYDDPAAPATHPPGFDTVALFDDPFTAVVPPGHHLADRSTITLRDLAEDTWIGGTPTSTWFAIVRRACHAAGFAPRAPFSTDDHGAVQAFVAAGLGVAVIPSLAIGLTAHTVRVLPLPRPRPTRRIGVALPPDAAEHPAAQAMIELLRRDGRRRRTTAAPAPA